MFFLCSLRLSRLLDPRRLAAELSDDPDSPEEDGDGGAEGAWLEAAAARWAAEDAAALSAQIADMEALRDLAMGLARAAAAAEMAGLEAVAAADDRSGEADETSPPASRAGAKKADTLFGRYARMARLTAMLETRLRGERRGLATGAAATKAAAKTPGPDPIGDWRPDPAMKAKVLARLMLLVSRKKTIVGVVQEVLADAGHDDETIEDVGQVLGEQLLDYEPSDMAEYSVGRMVARVCRRLGVTPADWSKFKDRDWAIEEAETMAQGSPFGDPYVEPLSWQCGVPNLHPDDPAAWGKAADPPTDPPAGGSP